MYNILVKMAKKGKTMYLKDNELDVKTYLELRTAVSWRSLTKEQAAAAIKGSLLTVVAYDGDKPIGMGRIVGDGAVICYIQDTLLRFAFNNTGLNDLDNLLNGTTSLALADDPVAPARVMADYAKKLDGKFEIKGGFMDGKPVDLATIQSLASIPALPVLQAQFLGTMLAPITGLAVVLKQIAEKNGAPAEEAAAEAPAAE